MRFLVASLLLVPACLQPKPVTFDDDGAGSDTDASDDDTGPQGGGGGGGGVNPQRIPPGMLLYTASEQGCPQGWTPWTDATGRAIVAAGDGSEVGVTVGEALDELAPRGHVHQVTVTLPVPSAGVASLSGCCNNDAGHSGDRDVVGALDEGGADLPTIGLRVCRRDGQVDYPASGTPFPAETTAFFDLPACPTGWTRVDEAVGRFVVGTPAGSPARVKVGDALASGEDRQHVHDVSISLTVPDLSLSAAGGSNTDPGASGDVFGEGVTDPASSGMAYVQALLCSLDAASPPTGADDDVVAPGLITWSTADTCADGWSESVRLQGRFPIGLPPGVVVGSVYGDPLGEAEDRVHGHTAALSLRLPNAALSILSGCCLSGIAQRGLFDVDTVVAPASTGLPTYALRPCARD